MIPVWTELSADFETPLTAYLKVRDERGGFLLESAEMTQQAGRFSILGHVPSVVFEVHGNQIKLTDSQGVRSWVGEEDPLKELEKIMAPLKAAPSPQLPVFHGGAVGYLGYDMIRHFEPTLPTPPADQLGLPDAVFFLTDTVLIFDHRFRKLLVVANVRRDLFESDEAAYGEGQRLITEILDKLSKPLHVTPLSVRAVSDDEIPEAKGNTTREEFHAMVNAGKEFIKAGDIFQFVPSQRFETEFKGQPLDLYRALRHVNPSPYMFCLEFPQGFALVGSSPEVHVRCLNGLLEIRPIAGTRWRGANQEEDEALADELLADPKERAEHLMLVDLARNDVGRAAEFGSVKVTEFMVVERYSHVMHLVSHVEGRLARDKTTFDVMRATFPAGTVSGSPKIRAMEIINSLEKSKRGAYAGAVGYFGYDGQLDSCIALRTCVIKDGKAYAQAGAGVVADSDPDYEYRETVNKARGMLKAIALARTLNPSESQPSA